MKRCEYMNGKYDDIIDLPHKKSATRPHMTMLQRAAQFSPFAALTGHGDAIKETARLTEKKIELGEDQKERLNERLQLICEQLNTEPIVTITYFVPDEKKDGGMYVEATGTVKKIDEYAKTVLLHDGTRIMMDDVLDIEGSLFCYVDND